MSTNDQANDPNWRPQPPETIQNERLSVEQQRILQQRNPSAVLLLILLFVFLSFGGSAEPYLAREQLRNALDNLIYQSSNYSAWLNGTTSNFTLLPTDHSFFNLLDLLQPPNEELDVFTSSYYHNVSGFLKGPASVFNLSGPLQPGWALAATEFFDQTQINQTELVRDVGNFNWTAADRITLSIQEHTPQSEGITVIHGSAVFNNEKEGLSAEMRMEGIHCFSEGTFYAYAVIKLESHLIDLRQLPSIVPSNIRNKTAHVIDLEYKKRVEKLKTLINSDSVDIETHDVPAESHCKFQIYGQLNPTNLSEVEMALVESELENPSGASVHSTPRLSMDAMLLSKNCGLVYQAKNLKGIKTQSFWRRATTYAGIAFLLYLVLLYVFVKQTKYASSRRRLTRLSWWTFLIQASTDAMVFTTHASFGIIEENRASLSLLGPGFLACILLLQEAQYVISIRQVQSSDQATEMGVIQSVIDIFTHVPILDRVTGTRGRVAIITTILIAGVLASIYSNSFAFWLFGTIYSSLWWPQIVRSARRGYRKALLKRYVFGISACRLVFLLYVYACPENIIGAQENGYVWLFVTNVAIENVVVFLQDLFGPAFFLPSDWWAEPVYDYHPVMMQPDPEAPEKSLGDCSICMDPILVQPETFDENAGRLQQVKNRRIYAVAPCHHLFHTRCLEQWMTVKSICPHCRRGLPAL